MFVVVSFRVGWKNRSVTRILVKYHGLDIYPHGKEVGG